MSRSWRLRTEDARVQSRGGRERSDECRVRNMNAAKNLEDKWKAPNHLFLGSVPAAERLSRDDLVKTANNWAVTAGSQRPWTWEIAEMFKIEKGKLRLIEAILEQVPYGRGSGWSNWEDQMSSRAR